MSKVLVVVCTRSAAQSALVDSEVGLFVRYGGGAIIPVQLDCPVEECGWRRHIRGLPANRRSGRRLPILNAIVGSFRLCSPKWTRPRPAVSPRRSSRRFCTLGSSTRLGAFRIKPLLDDYSGQLVHRQLRRPLQQQLQGINPCGRSPAIPPGQSAPTGCGSAPASSGTTAGASP